jgi:transcriptional regulator with XRE-family HTH domain
MKNAAVSGSPEGDEIDLSQARIVRRGPRRPVHLPLKSLREAAGFTQTQVAKASGIAQGDVSKLEREASLDRREIRTLRQYLAAIGDDIEIAALSSLGHRIVIVGAHAQAPLRIVPGQVGQVPGQGPIETAFADAMMEAAADGRLAAMFAAKPQRRKTKTKKNNGPPAQYWGLYGAKREAEQACAIYGDARSRMLATVLGALEHAVYAADLKALTKLHKVARKVLGEKPERFGPLEWKDFEKWLLQQTRAAILAGITLPELASAVGLAIALRAPVAAPYVPVEILRAWEKVATRRPCVGGLFDERGNRVDGDGHVLNDEAVIKDLLTAALRAAGIDAGARKDPFGYEKDKLGLRVSHKAKGVKSG